MADARVDIEMDDKGAPVKASSVVDKLEELSQEDDEEDFEKEGEEVEKWSSRWSFILAAIGSAIGLGNFWRFPFLAYKYGGGAFFIPYLIALFVVGIPLMQLEMAIGQVFRRAAVQAFGKLHPRARGVGLAASLIAFGIVTYYHAILGWGNVFLVKSFQKDMPWSVRGLPNRVNRTATFNFTSASLKSVAKALDDIEDEEALAGLGITELDDLLEFGSFAADNETFSMSIEIANPDIINIPANHFVGDVLQLSSDYTESYIISSSVFAGVIFMWASVFFILWKGQAFISKAVWITVLLPVVMLLILMGVGLSLDGAGEGVKKYIGTWDMSLLSEGQMWADAFGQIFFSLSLSTGVMTAYAAMNPRNQNIVQDACIVAISNCVFSFMAGFAVFTVVGYYAKQTDKTFEELNPFLAGPKLAFIAYPTGLSLIEGYGANILTILFFITFYFLGVDSAFSLVESAVLNLREVPFFSQYTRLQMTMMVCFFGFINSILFCSDIGLYLLDVIDFYIATFSLPIVGFLECATASWFYKSYGAAPEVGVAPLLVHNLLVPIGMLLFVLLVNFLPFNEDLTKGAVFGISFGVALPIVLAGLIVPPVMAMGKVGSFKDAAYYTLLYNVDHLCKRLNSTITKGAEGNWKLNIVWAALMKFIVTPTLLMLIGVQCAALVETKGYARGDYPLLWFQFTGLPLFFILLLVIIFAALFPAYFADPHARARGQTL